MELSVKSITAVNIYHVCEVSPFAEDRTELRDVT
jgi:hypothetical protein